MLKDARRQIALNVAERSERDITRKLGAMHSARTKAELSDRGTLHVHLVSGTHLKAGDYNGLSGSCSDVQQHASCALDP